MKQSDGFTRFWPTALTMLISIALLSWSMRVLPLGTAYSAWTGVGAVGSFTFDILVLGKSATPMRLGAAVLIVGGLVLMKLASAES